MIKALLFDLDGTLIDSMPLWKSLDRMYVESKGCEYLDETTDELKSISFKEAPGYFKEKYGFDSTYEEMHKFMFAILLENYKNVFLFKEGVEEKLKAFRDKGYKMAITTATDYILAINVIERLGIDKYMDLILTPDKAGYEKSDRRFFDLALEKMGISAKDAAVFDDALYAVKLTKEMGMAVVGVYDKSSEKEIMEIKKLSNIFIESFKDLQIEDIEQLGL